MPRSGRLAGNGVVVALLAGVAYLVIGRVSAAPTDYRHGWRFAAWAASAAVFLAQIAYEHLDRRSQPRTIALHAALGAAVGGFLLALVVAVRVWSTAPSTRSAWLVALVAWPLLTGIPAFVVALAIAFVLRRRTSIPGAV